MERLIMFSTGLLPLCMYSSTLKGLFQYFGVNGIKKDRECGLFLLAPPIIQSCSTTQSKNELNEINPTKKYTPFENMYKEFKLLPSDLCLMIYNSKK